MKQFDKFEEIKNELLEFGNDYKKIGNTDLGKSFVDAASLVKDLTETYKKSNYSNHEELKLKIKINHNFNYLKYVMTANYCTNNITSKYNAITQFALGSFNRYYEFFQFDHTIAMA
ncbi:MAG: hypothetical protein K0S53_1032 [Bacteroidetes bacterium]|jgi:hypothetical protein|nr:hypothetical protein [Bacteroidota bacterium]MDF2453156.1 hypothetical protein [Bacteroidota bacterium]